MSRRCKMYPSSRKDWTIYWSAKPAIFDCEWESSFRWVGNTTFFFTSFISQDKTDLSKSNRYWGPICICIFFVMKLHQRVFNIPSSSTKFSHAWISFQFLLIIHLFTDLTTPEKQLLVLLYTQKYDQSC